MADTTLAQQEAPVSCDQALRIAHSDVEKVYRDLSLYRIALSQEEEGGQVDFELRDQSLQGGGPHYLIDLQSGEIISKRYEQ